MLHYTLKKPILVQVILQNSERLFINFTFMFNWATIITIHVAHVLDRINRSINILNIYVRFCFACTLLCLFRFIYLIYDTGRILQLATF